MWHEQWAQLEQVGMVLLGWALRSLYQGLRNNLNGIGRKVNNVTAELIIQAHRTDDPAFDVLVRKLINGI